MRDFKITYSNVVHYRAPEAQSQEKNARADMSLVIRVKAWNLEEAIANAKEVLKELPLRRIPQQKTNVETFFLEEAECVGL